MTKGIISLFTESGKIYKSKFKIFLGIIALPFVLIIIGTFVPLVGIEPVKAFIIAVILLLTAIFIWLFAILALLFSLKDNFDVKTCYKESFKMIKSFLGVCFLMFCLSIGWIITGIILPLLFIYLLFPFFIFKEKIFAEEVLGRPDFLYFLFDEHIEGLIIIGGLTFLFIIIGVILFIKFFLSIYVLVFEENKGIKALSIGKKLIAGNFWKVLWRIFVLAFTIIVIGFSFNFVLILTGTNLTIVNIINYIFIWFVIPFCLIYGFLIYKNLREVKVETFSPNFFKKRKRNYIKIGIYIIIGVLGLSNGLTSLGVVANLIYRANDEPPYDDRDLWLPRIEIPVRANAFYDFAPYLITQFNRELFLQHWPEQERQALKEIEFKKIYWPWPDSPQIHLLIDNIFKDKEWDKEFAKHLLKKNEQVLNAFEKAVKRPYFQNPMIQDPKNIGMETPMIFMGGLLNIMRLNLIKSAYLFEQGKEQEAFEQAIKIIEMGQMIQDSPRPMLINYLVGVMTKEMGLKKIRVMIPKTNLSSEILQEYIVRLEQFKLNEKGLAHALKMEYILIINIKKEIEADVESSFFYKPDQIHRKIAEFRRANINNIYTNYYKDIEALEHPFVLKPFPWVIIEENLVGKMMLEFVMFPMDDKKIRKFEEDLSVISTQLLLAIRAYQIETGEIPISLDKLVPKYISEIPRDPFDGEPIRFCPERKIIYSVGKNLIDEGGSKEEHWRGMPDPTFEIKF